MKVSKDDSLTQAFVLENDDLEKLHSELTDYLPRIKFIIECKDSLKREFDSFPDFIKFENTSNNEILVLRITGYNHDLDTTFFLRFDKDSYKNIHIIIESNEENAIKLSECFERRLNSIKPWYYPLARKGIPLILGGLLWNSLFIYNLVRGNYSISSMSKISEVPFPYVVILIVFLLITIPLFIWLSNKFNNLYLSIFPKGVFAMNQGLKRHKDKEVIRTVVVLGFIISFVSSLVVSLLFLFLT